jgi:8-oxo-dGTP pyrophosphatase MutT (NUDIX family)
MKERVRQALARAPRVDPASVLAPRQAAVSAVLFPGETGLDLLLLKRAEKAGDPWSGHIAFPGGRVEPGETVLQAAVRETVEELGLNLEGAELLGELDQVATRGPLPAMVIHPHVWFMESLPDLSPNAEVATVHRLGLDVLLTGEGRSSMMHPWREHRVELPVVQVDGHRLWGLTLHIVDDLLDRLDGRGRGLERTGRRSRTPWEDPRS